jgi:hypothetical protein
MLLIPTTCWVAWPLSRPSLRTIGTGHVVWATIPYTFQPIHPTDCRNPQLIPLSHHWYCSSIPLVSYNPKCGQPFPYTFQPTHPTDCRNPQLILLSHHWYCSSIPLISYNQNAALWPNILGLGVHGHDAEPTFTLYSSGSIQSAAVLQGKSLKEILSF